MTEDSPGPWILEAIESLHIAGGGPSRGIPRLAQHLSQLGQPTALVQVRYKGPETEEFHQALAQGVRSPGVSEALSGARLLHLHGLWSWRLHRLQKAFAERGPVIISPHGMLEPWALAQGALKKKAALAVFQMADLRAASAIHATSESEAQNIRKLGLRNPIVVIAPGVDLDLAREVGSFSRPGERRMLFLSRLHPKKGLSILLEAMAERHEALREGGWRLLVAGAGLPRDTDHYRAQASAGPAHDLIDFYGQVDDATRAALFAAADLFVLPTFSENFGSVIVEALAAGVPVITTQGTPWSILRERRCGWWVPIGPSGLEEALEEALDLDREALRAMGRRGRDLAVSQFSWSATAAKTLETYRWALGQGPLPEFML
jgi:glycosyltransferase involved in cell wall biosynthesis